MTEDKITPLLRGFGLTEKESEVYVFLAKSGVQKAGEVSKRLRMHKAQVYRLLEVLQSKGLVESTLEFPTRFIPVSFENLLDLIIRVKKEETARLEEEKSELLTCWGSIRVEKPPPSLAKFTVMKGKERIYSKILQLIEEAKKEVLVMSDSVGIVQIEQAGITEVIGKNDIRFRILTNVSKQNYRIVKRVLRKTLPKNLKIEGRHKDLGANVYPRFVIRDNEEVVFFLTPTEDSSTISRAETGLWTNSKEIVSALKIFFEGSWGEATDARERITEIEMGTPIKETLIIRDAEIAYQRFCRVIDEVKTEIIAVTTSEDLTRILMDRPVRRWSEKGVKIHIMVPLDLESLEAAEELSKYFQLRYSGDVYTRIAVVDNRHLFMFKVPPPNNKTAEPSAYFDNLLYSNDPDYVEGMKNMLDDLWNKSPAISDIAVGAAMRSPPTKVSATDPTSKVIEKMLANNIGSVIVAEGEKPVGMITERDILNRVVRNRRDPERIPAEKIMSTPVITIDRDRTLLEALKVMKAKEIRRLVVIEEGRLVGVLSERRALEKSEISIVKKIENSLHEAIYEYGDKT
jgi:sugar-specific transcriptional regulator TrmB/CBS domain-containing protein